MKRAHLKRFGSGRKSRFRIDRIHNYEGKLLGSIEITHAPFESPYMKGVYHHPHGDVLFEGEWEEGFFTINKLKPLGDVEISGFALTDLEKEVSKRSKATYTDEGSE